MNFLFKNNKIILKCLIFLFLLSFGFSLKAESVLSEIISVHSEDGLLMFDVARKYPEIKLESSPGKIVIVLKDSKYHKVYNFDDYAKATILNNLAFVRDISVNYSGEDVNEILIVLDADPGKNIKPKLKSTINNVLSLGFDIADAIAEEKKPELTRDEIYNQAVENQINGNLELAEKLYNEVSSKDKSFYFARFNLAKVYLDKQMYENAINILHDLLADLAKSNADKKLLLVFQNTLGTIYYLSEAYDKAIEQFRNIIKFDKNFYLAYYNLALVCEKTKDIRGAKKYLLKVLELKPDFIQAHYHMGILNLISKNKKDAVVSFKKVIEISSSDKLAELSKKELEQIEQ
jgi:tetratricopeptide (TPR) repeat protein